jgi:hypothetical protein
LDGQWKFFTSEAQDEPAWITVPAPWQADARFRDHIGTAWYERELDLPMEWFADDRVIILGFGAVDYRCEVWLNQIKIGEHEGGYLPFELDITESARSGINNLRIRVDDPLEIFAEIPHGKQSWYGLISGIWQSVWMESRPSNHIQRIKISTSGEHVEVHVFGSGTFAEGLTALVLSPDGETAAQVKSFEPRFSLRVEQPLAWSPDEPNLYTLKVSTPQDEFLESFGFRTIETHDGKILLNGKPFYLRGALDQDYYPDLIYTAPSQEYIEEQFRKAKEMGLNCLRIHIKVGEPRYYAAADKIGLLIWTELPNYSLLTESSKRHARTTIAGMLERDNNHPCIGIWTIINESWGIDLTDPAQRSWLVEMYHWLKELDPTRLVVDNSACWGNFHVSTDIADYHIYYAMPDHDEQWDEWLASFANRPWWLFAHDYAGHQPWRDFVRNPWHIDAQDVASDVELKGDEPLILSEFGNWGLPDVHKLYEGNHGTAPWWFDTGLEWGDGVVYPRGIEQRFREYHLDRVFPELSVLTEASQRLQYQAMKYEIEQMRRYESIQGYIITEFTDLHWECNGLLDMYRNPKAYYSQMKELNRDDLLIPLCDRIVVSADENCTVEVLCSHYSSSEITDSALEWEIVANNLSLSGGGAAINQCIPYRITKLGSVRFEAPRVDAPTKAKLKLRLINQENLIGTAEQEIYLFPPNERLPRLKAQIFSREFQNSLEKLGGSIVDDLASADFAVTTTLDDSFRDFILRGGKVLFLAEREDAIQTHVPGLSVMPRNGTVWQGDWASSFGWHRFPGLPTDGVVNFAFTGLTPEHVLYGFTPLDFAFDVYAGLFVGWLHKPVPTIARRRMGEGEVLVSTFRLAQNLDNNPMAMYLFHELLHLAV